VPALRQAHAAACALPVCRTLDLEALRTRSAHVAAWLLQPGLTGWCMAAGPPGAGAFGSGRSSAASLAAWPSS